MFVLYSNFIEDVSGGYLAAVNTFVTVFGIPAAFMSSLEVYQGLGQQLGELLFEFTHKDVLGKMVFDFSDLSHERQIK